MFKVCAIGGYEGYRGKIVATLYTEFPLHPREMFQQYPAIFAGGADIKPAEWNCWIGYDTNEGLFSYCCECIPDEDFPEDYMLEDIAVWFKDEGWEVITMEAPTKPKRRKTAKTAQTAKTPKVTSG